MGKPEEDATLQFGKGRSACLGWTFANNCQRIIRSLIGGGIASGRHRLTLPRLNLIFFVPFEVISFRLEQAIECNLSRIHPE